MAKSFVQARATHYPGANLIEAHTSGASDKLSNVCAVTAIIRVAGVFTMPLFHCPSQQILAGLDLSSQLLLNPANGVIQPAAGLVGNLTAQQDG